MSTEFVDIQYDRIPLSDKDELVEIDTIVAQATACAPGAVGVVRVSGPLTEVIAQKMLGKKLRPRHATLVDVFDACGQVLDTGIGLFFSGPNSFTGEDVLELQCHGGLAVLDLMLKSCVQLGARMARPGEFSERAFLNGKIDLCQAEAIADLVSASTEQAARSAHRSLSGVFSDKINILNKKITELRVYVEAAIDFVDEEIDFLSETKVLQSIQSIEADLTTLLKQAKAGQLLQEGKKVVIAGKPNVGKSSLFNCLAQNDVAIVTAVPGTTRDIIKESIQINGVLIHLLDTAGLRDTVDVVEVEGIRRAKAQFELADKILLVIDATQNPLLTNVELEILEDYSDKISLVLNKIDLIEDLPVLKYDFVALSVEKKRGVEQLHAALCGVGGNISEGVFSARRRHVDALEVARQHIQRAHYQLVEVKAGELLAEELRQAQCALGEITGKMTSDELLGKIFSTFCIGK